MVPAATIFELEGLGTEKRKYLKWVLTQPLTCYGRRPSGHFSFRMRDHLQTS
jgi:hypothetical protein